MVESCLVGEIVVYIVGELDFYLEVGWKVFVGGVVLGFIVE